MELPRSPKTGNSERSDNDSSQWSEKEGPKQSEQSDHREGSQKPRVKYGSRPPESVRMTNAELSQWILEAEQEDRRLATIEQAKKCQIVDEKSQRNGSGSPANNQPVANAAHLPHQRGCKYRLPSTDPIPIPTIPYDPSNKWWLHQELRRRLVCFMKKTNKALCEMADDGFGIQIGNDVENGTTNEHGEQYVDCPACRSSSEEGNLEIEITVGQVIKIAFDQEIEITAVDQDIEIAEDAAAIITSTEPAAQETQASTTANRIKSYLQRFLNFRGTIPSTH